MAKIITYDEYISGLSGEEKVILDLNTCEGGGDVNKLLDNLCKIPSYMYSMLTPRIEFFLSGEKKIDLFYRPRKFPTKFISESHQERDGFAGIKEFTVKSNEFMGLNNLTQFELKFDVMNPRMFNAGHDDNPDLLEFFKVKRSYPLIANFGWNLSGIKEIDEIVNNLGIAYPLILNPSNWNLSITGDRITCVDIVGWAGLNQSEKFKILVGSHMVPDYLNILKKIDEERIKGELDANNKKISKEQKKLHQQNIIKIGKPMYDKFAIAYARIFETIKNSGNYSLKNILKAFLPDLEYFEKTNAINIIIVLGKYNKTKNGMYESENIENITFPINDLQKKYFSIDFDKTKSRPITFSDFLTNLVNDYLNNEKWLSDKKVDNENQVSPQVKLKWSVFDNKLFIIIDDINRYYNSLYIKKLDGASLNDKYHYAYDNNIPIIDLEKMNNIVMYPVDINSHVDESIQSIMIQKSYEKQEKKANVMGATSNSKDINSPYEYYPLNCPFNMIGNFILKPFQTIFLTWASERFCRFYTINNMSYKINENGQFICSYEPVHTIY